MKERIVVPAIGPGASSTSNPFGTWFAGGWGRLSVGPVCRKITVTTLMAGLSASGADLVELEALVPRTARRPASKSFWRALSTIGSVGLVGIPLTDDADLWRTTTVI